MPLSFAQVGEVRRIQAVHGAPKMKQHLANLGFVAGADVTVINEVAGNLIVRVKEARIAISRSAANRIMV